MTKAEWIAVLFSSIGGLLAFGIGVLVLSAFWPLSWAILTAAVYSFSCGLVLNSPWLFRKWISRKR